MEPYDGDGIVSIGVGFDLAVRVLALRVRPVVGYTGQPCYDTMKPGGTPCNLVDVIGIIGLGWRARIEVEDRIRRTYDWFVVHQAD